MLVLSRKVNERIQIGDEVTITVVRISPNSVRLGVQAPPHLAVLRDELNDEAIRIGPAEGLSLEPRTMAT